ncbi:M20/M25/M40 family metallo-hydrolase [Enterocloster lavalensis]|uniref:M20/M25/M40 family metallo-hydrolase n=1 Tax=Enterocloster lavalensis TaxID=460384 RepID=UPI001D090B19|nr:M20/M25/M40 family metallo-hydrolase [Enterocloster lavalensis]MCB6343065.1 M20/M25/M40 family metallo-hydrolase [Enterocloster lavalensis]
MDLRECIYHHLKELVAIPSISNTKEESLAADYLAKSLAEQDYFRANPGLCGQFPIEGDPLGRTVAYGLVRGNGRRTVILTGHYDVVDTEEYGEFRKYAYDVEAWKNASGPELEGLLEMLTPEAREDFCSGEWLFGRGVNDMKGGLAVGLAVTGWFGGRVLEGRGLEGNILFLSVPDEEAYSAGMRGAVPLFVDLARRYDLDYACLLDLEPCFDEGGGQQVFIGSVGKMLPAVLVQGAKAHVVEAFKGLNAVGVLARLFLETELAPEFAEVCEGELCPPPTWFNLRDRKEGYDVSVPLRAGGYMSVLGFQKTAETLMERLVELGRKAFSEYLARMEGQRLALEEMQGGGEDGAEVAGDCGSGIADSAEAAGDCGSGLDDRGEHCGSAAYGAELPGGRPSVVPCETVPPYSVLEYRELADYCVGKYGSEAFADWQREQQREAGEMIRAGRWSYPQATLELMDRLLTWSKITAPVMVLSYAPPYYPAYHSDHLPGRAGAGSALFDLLARAAAGYGVRLEKGNYFCGISDLSYCGGGEGPGLEGYAANSPMWGGLYSMDSKAMKQFCAPALLFGPVGRDAHQMGEQVKAASLLEEVPSVLIKFIEQMFANGGEI